MHKYMPVRTAQIGSLNELGSPDAFLSMVGTSNLIGSGPRMSHLYIEHAHTKRLCEATKE